MTEHHQPNLLDARLRSVWRRDQVLNRTAGLLAFCRWALLLFLIGMAVDWLVDLPAAGRVGILVILIVVALSKAWQSGWRHLRRFDPSRTALRVEKHHGGLESLLVTAIQLGESGSVPGTSEALRAKTCRLAEEAAGPLRPEDAVSYKGLRRFLLLALIPVVIIGGFRHSRWAVSGSRLWPHLHSLACDCLPHAHADRIGAGRSDRQGGREPAPRCQDWRRGSGRCRAHLAHGPGQARERNLAIVNGVCEYKAEAVFRSFDYRVSAGDAETAWHTVRVISAPRIERAEVTLKFPEYVRRAAETVEALTLTVPEGTTIQWKLALDRAVDEAEFRPAEGTALPLKISSDGRSVTMEQVAAESRAYSFGWVDKEHEFDFSSPRYYLQVAPDQRPSVDLTSPRGNLFATLERKLDFAFRGRDDHGIGEAAITYRLNKIEEEKVALPAPKLSDGSEQRIDWNYREALPNLAVGDTVSFAIELADRYPGADGPHRVRSDTRRVQFLSREDYLAQIEKQKRRLLTRIRTIYREERGVHDLVRRLDPSDDLFVQTCQLEAVRQGLIGERLGAIRNRINALVEDLAANKVAEEAESAAMAKLGTDLQTIADEHVGRAASLLRELATVTDGGGEVRNPAAAIAMVDSSARELGLVVLQLGFAEASDVMARELHATAQTQAALRLQTILGEDADAAAKDQLAETQARLARETARLLAATPRNKESTSTDAIVAFKLSRLVNGLVRSGADAKMREAAALVPKAESENAARLQAEVIAALLRAGVSAAPRCRIRSADDSPRLFHRAGRRAEPVARRECGLERGGVCRAAVRDRWIPVHPAAATATAPDAGDPRASPQAFRCRRTRRATGQRFAGCRRTCATNGLGAD